MNSTVKRVPPCLDHVSPPSVMRDKTNGLIALAAVRLHSRLDPEYASPICLQTKKNGGCPPAHSPRQQKTRGSMGCAWGSAGKMGKICRLPDHMEHQNRAGRTELHLRSLRGSARRDDDACWRRGPRRLFIFSSPIQTSLLGTPGEARPDRPSRPSPGHTHSLRGKLPQEPGQEQRSPFSTYQARHHHQVRVSSISSSGSSRNRQVSDTLGRNTTHHPDLPANTQQPEPGPRTIPR